MLVANCQVGKVYRIVVREHAEAFALLGVLLEYTAPLV